MVIRLLDKSEALFDPAGIGLEGDNLEKYQRLIGSNNGMVLIVGPTGSGKISPLLNQPASVVLLPFHPSRFGFLQDTSA